MVFTVDDNWDKSKTYLSPSKDRAAIFINGRWELFTSDKEVQNILANAQQFHIPKTKEMDEYEISIFHRSDYRKDDWDSPTIKHFQDY